MLPEAGVADQVAGALGAQQPEAVVAGDLGSHAIKNR